MFGPILIPTGDPKLFLFVRLDRKLFIPLLLNPSLFTMAIVNRLGFNNKGINNFLSNLTKRNNFGSPVGINIGPNKDSKNFIDDYVNLANQVHDYADYITINISSPNTENLRNLQNKNELEELIKALVSSLNDKKIQKPIFIKINPDENLSLIHI